MECVQCGKELENGLDTFGPVDEPRCADCWWAELLNKEPVAKSLFGIVAGLTDTEEFDV